MTENKLEELEVYAGPALLLRRDKKTVSIRPKDRVTPDLSDMELEYWGEEEAYGWNFDVFVPVKRKENTLIGRFTTATGLGFQTETDENHLELGASVLTRNIRVPRTKVFKTMLKEYGYDFADRSIVLVDRIRCQTP